MTTIDGRAVWQNRSAWYRLWHTRALILYMVITLGHASEHVVQAIQVFVLGWPRPQSGGLLGFWMPELVTSEVLHFTYNFIQLIGLILLWRGLSGRARRAWTIAMLIQGWHFFEHFLLQTQWLTGHFLFGKSHQISIGELLLPRVELHFIYVAIVTAFALLALYWHFRLLGRQEILANLLSGRVGIQPKQAESIETK